MNEKILTIQHLEFSYGLTPALQGVNIEMSAGEFIGVFGPNGGGKTTLLKLILGFLQPQKGTLLLFGEPPEKTRHLIGYVPQSARFDRDFPITVLDVVMMGALQELNWLGRYPAGTRGKALEALARVGLEKKTKSSFGTLSGGETQRALIARAILNSPRLLILDEPTANIDPAGESSIHDLLVDLNQTMGILMVTHDLQTILDKVGRLLCVQNKVTSLKTAEICEHFALGLYHTPLSTKHYFPAKGPLS